MIAVRGEGGSEESLSLEEFEARVRAGELAPSTPVRFPVLTGDRWVDARELEVFRRLYAPARIHFSRAFSLGRFPVFTFALCLAQLVIFLAVGQGARLIPLDRLIEAGAKVGPCVLELGETWRLLAANLLHRDVVHLAFNTFFLFNVGGAVENAYRVEDLALVLVAAGIGTTAASVLLSAMPSVGASGMVLGLFGSATVFGYKYGDILPVRYRRYFGGAVLPYALFILYVGLATENTDNWGHLGGLAGGALATLPLEPRLLALGGPRRGALRAHAPALAALVLVAAVFAAGPVIRLAGPALVEAVDEASGLAFAHPSRWVVGENHLGHASLGNALGVSMGLRAERGAAPVGLPELRRRFVEEVLAAREAEGDIARVELGRERPFLLAGGRALELEATLESRVGRQRTRNVLIERGLHRYVVVLSAPEAWAEAYAPLFDALLARLALVAPADLEQAERLVTAFPGMSSAWAALGDRRAEVGDVPGAARAYQQALAGIPDQPEATHGLVKLALDHGGDLAAAVPLARDLVAGAPEAPGHAVLLAEVLWRLGLRGDACRALQEAADRADDPAGTLRSALAARGCRAGAHADR